VEGGGEGEERGLRGLIDGGWERGGVYRMASFVHYMGWLHLYTTMSGGKHYNTIAVSINIYVVFHCRVHFGPKCIFPLRLLGGECIWGGRRGKGGRGKWLRPWPRLQAARPCLSLRLVVLRRRGADRCHRSRHSSKKWKGG